MVTNKPISASPFITKLTFTFFDVDLHFAEVEIVDVVGRDSLQSDKSAPNCIRARHDGGLWRGDRTRMITAEAVQLRSRAADTHFNVSHTAR